ncbi:dTDP-4-dehydrorhamnose reductase [Altericroceibacterium xinjiangense]|uniref:dTDP-4-dehydrorhamnose reductase n=1 Tax=Altericroceibacterium xinjiangense TaxID=762261 RepID=UPI000F7F505A|nr:dTDP-4-dehydrorhamnose reductase [Altericroceibacterium xinjiangense]
MARSVLVTGGEGQIGRELQRLSWPSGLVAVFPGRDRLDLCNPESIAEYVAGTDWGCIVNCAAWTAVDAAEDAVAEAFRVNAQGPALLAEAAARARIPFVQLSTDYVFDGRLDRPYREDDPVCPRNAYGASKLAGELAVRAAHPRAVVLRTAWVLSVHRTNFLKTMLRLADTRKQLSVVADQVGCPTSASDIAKAIRQICQRLIDDPSAPCGIYHFAGAGSASWHELACAIFDDAALQGRRVPEVNPIETQDYPTRAARPANSRLETSRITQDFGIVPRPWRDAVRDIVDELQTQEQPA